MGEATPLVWCNKQRAVRAPDFRPAGAARIVERARPAVAAAARRGSVLGSVEEITIVLVSDRRIARLHAEFLGDPAPTDVITFLHGEIVLSAETAQREARVRGIPTEHEVARYAVHGLLHLAGWTDDRPDASAEMRLMQEKILRQAARGLC
jgi:probable rRNA maturation factor